jgi:hypothetical protein
LLLPAVSLLLPLLQAAAHTSPLQHAGADLKIQLSATDYGNFLSNEPSPLVTTTIAERAKDKLVSEFLYLRAHANAPLATFLDYIT